MFQNPWESVAPFVAGDRRQQQHVEYLAPHSKPDDKRLTVVHLLVDNRDRDLSFDRNKGNTAASDFVVRFDRITEIIAIEPKIVCCPKPPNECYAVLNIKQFDNQLQSSDPSAQQATSVLFFDLPRSCHDTKPVRSDLLSCKRIDFDQPISLDRLDVRLSLHGGAPLQLADNDNTITVLLDITCNQLSALYGL